MSYKVKVYIVEDNVLYARVLKKQLTDDGLQVKVFHNGTDFIKNLGDKPDVVTLDYTLPDMTGKEVLATIQEKMPSTQVIVISAQEDISTAIELMKNGAYDYIMKAPDTREKLSRVIKNIYNTISEGGRDGKGMIAWKNSFSSEKIQQLANYIISLQGTNPENAKAPEGEKWEGE